mmetsp:Transcript_31701/g.48255  ORF Transcript_31701/g.48255 Transcript_31701/m.48255 type:complete len:157 (+) Transcript_31701:85-555(+)
MKFTTAVLLALPAVNAFGTTTFVQKTTRLNVGSDPNVFLGGNEWKPDSEKMGATDTGDYFPEGYNADDEPAFEVGMGGSQGFGRQDQGPQLPGMENLGADAVIQGGIELSEEIPAGMEFIPSSVPDMTVDFQIGSSSDGMEFPIQVAPVCMTFEGT